MITESSRLLMEMVFMGTICEALTAEMVATEQRRRNALTALPHLFLWSLRLQR